MVGIFGSFLACSQLQHKKSDLQSSDPSWQPTQKEKEHTSNFLIPPTGLIDNSLVQKDEFQQPWFQHITAQTQKTQQAILLEFTTEWCGTCKKFKKEVLSNPKVQELFSIVLSIEYDAEKGEGAKIAEQFKIANYPTFVFLDPEGNEIDRYIGFLDIDNFLITAKNIFQEKNTLKDYIRQLQTRPQDITLHYEIGLRYGWKLDSENAMIFLGYVAKRDPQNQFGFTDKSLYQIGRVLSKTGKSEQAIDYLQKLIATFPQSLERASAYSLLAKTYDNSGREDLALKTYRSYLNENKTDPKAQNAFAWFCAGKKIALDEALIVAQKAVESTNEKEPGILDTLAEVLFAKQEIDAAVSTIDKAIALDPEDKYYYKQKTRFLAAKESNSK